MQLTPQIMLCLDYEVGLTQAADEDPVGLLTFKGLVAGICEGRYIAVPARDGVLILSENEVNGGSDDAAKFLCIVAATGELDALLDTLPQIEQMARSIGCCKIVVSGRSGWTRTLPKHDPAWYARGGAVIKVL